MLTNVYVRFEKPYSYTKRLPNEPAALDKAFRETKLTRHIAANYMQAMASGMTNTDLLNAFKAEASCASFGCTGGLPP